MNELTQDEFREAIRQTHGADASFDSRSVVDEVFDGKPVWAGEVLVFSLRGHPTATKCYAWFRAPCIATPFYIRLRSPLGRRLRESRWGLRGESRSRDRQPTRVALRARFVPPADAGSHCPSSRPTGRMVRHRAGSTAAARSVTARKHERNACSTNACSKN